MQTSLTFRRLRYQNLLSTGNIFTEIDLDSVPMTLVVGDNGDGKSTFIDALCFVLFKKPFRKINLPQLVNSVTGKGLLVEVEFDSRGHSYLVRRGIKPNLFEVYEDGSLIDQTLTKDYQAEFEKRIIRTNYKTFVQIVILGSASYVPFMQLKSHERRPIVEDIYDCGIFTQMKVILSKKLSDLERELNVMENERDLLNHKLEVSRKKQEFLTDDKQKWIHQKQSQITFLESGIEKVEEKLKDLHAENELMAPVIAEEAKHKKQLSELETLQHKITANANSVRKEIEWLTSHENCPTCKQHIAPEFKTRTIEEKDRKLDEISDGLQKLFHKVEEITSLKDKLSYAQLKVSSNKTQEYILGSEISTYTAQIKNLKKEIRQLQEEKEDVIDEAEVIELESRIIAKKREWAEAALERDAMEYINSKLKDSGIKAQIIKKYSASFNTLVNAYLAKLDFFVDFHLDENFEETIKSRGRDNFSYNSFSEGEKLRIDLAVLFAWRDIARTRASLNTNLLVMDEVFDGSLDAQGVEELLKIMTRVTEGNNVFVISHQIDRLDGHFDRKIRFTKTKGFSRILDT